MGTARSKWHPLAGSHGNAEHHGFHINADCVILEFVKDGERVSYGESGEVVATSLYRYGMPAIRYKLYDFAVPERRNLHLRARATIAQVS